MLSLLSPFRPTTRSSSERNLSTYQREFDRLFDGVLSDWPSTGARSVSAPAAEVLEDADALRIVFDVPGLEEKDVSVEITANVLTISGERRQGARENDRVHLSERWYGAFRKSVVLPSGVDAAHISANVAKGVLTVVLPKDASDKPRKIAVTSA